MAHNLLNALGLAGLVWFVTWTYLWTWAADATKDPKSELVKSSGFLALIPAFFTLLACL